MLRIGEFAALSGVSPKRLRRYDESGLFRPAWTDPASGYRFYSPSQLPELHRVIALSGLGIPLAAVAELVRGGADLAEALHRRRSELQDERAALELRLAAIRVELERDVFGDPLGIVVRPVTAQRVAALTADLRAGDQISALFDEIEAHVRDQGARAASPPALIEWDRTAQAARIEIAIPTTRAVSGTDRIANRMLEAADMATLIHRGDYAGLRDARSRLSAFLAASGLEPAGPLRLVYLQFSGDAALRLPPPFLVGAATQFVTELQQPVRRPAGSPVPHRAGG